MTTPDRSPCTVANDVFALARLHWTDADVLLFLSHLLRSNDAESARLRHLSHLLRSNDAESARLRHLLDAHIVAPKETTP
jgi:hypothetical protein